MQDSIFTKIIKGEIPCYKLYEDEKVIAFLDVHPLKRGHMLVVPKTQIDHIWDLPRDEYAYLMGVTRRLGAHLKKTLHAPRVAMVVEGFGVPHAHVHLIPIDDEKDLKRTQDNEKEIEHELLAEVAKELVVDSIFAV